MNCHYCHGVDTVEETTTRFCACDAPAPFIVENVPASMCCQCGDKAFSGDVVETFEKIRNGEYQANGSRLVKVFDMEKLGQPPEDKPESSSVFFPRAHQWTELAQTLRLERPLWPSRVVPKESTALTAMERSSAWGIRETPDFGFERWQRPENLSLNLRLNPAADQIVMVSNLGS